jgi:RNA polymerase sigma-70 factor (ECF subfamily)
VIGSAPMDPKPGFAEQGDVMPGAMVGAADPSDEALLERIARGDSDALGVLYDRYARVAIAVGYRVLGEHGAAEDVVQEAFLAVWRRVDSFNPTRGSVRSWLLTIVRNGAVDRRRGRHARALQDAALDDVAFRLATGDEETFETVAASFEAERVREALATLPPDQREAIELAYFGGLTHQEIAQKTGAPLGTIKGRMRLGLHKLRNSLGDLLPPDSSSQSGDAPAQSARAAVADRPAGPFARLTHGRPRLRLAPVAG